MSSTNTGASQARRPRTEADKLKAAGIVASRLNLTLLEPEVLTLITDPQHPLYDERVNYPVDPESPLYKDIASKGVEKPIEVRKNGEDDDGKPILQVVDGRQRVMILRHVNVHLPAGAMKRKLPVNFVTGQDRELVLRGLSSNLLRVEETALSKAVKAQKARSLGCSMEEIAQACNLRTVKPIEELLLILNFMPEVQKAFNGELPAAAIKTFAKVPREKQLDALTKMRSSGAKTSRQVKAAVEAARDGKQYVAPPANEQKAWSPAKMEELLAQYQRNSAEIVAKLKELHDAAFLRDDSDALMQVASLNSRKERLDGGISTLKTVLGLYAGPSLVEAEKPAPVAVSA